MKYMLDVGAHFGEDSIEKTRADANLKCFAFEPTPELVERLSRDTESFKDRYQIADCAIADFDGESEFHLVVNDTGSASLNEFSDHLRQTWPDRHDFVVRKTIKVKVYRLDSWFKEFAPEVSEIEYLHIDAQGSDLAVLKGLGEMIKMVKAGVVEVPESEDVKLYKVQHSKEETLEFLKAAGFNIKEMRPQQNEINIFFERP